MTSLVQICIDQITKPSWLLEPSEEWRSNKTAIRRRIEHRQYLVAEIKRFGRPVTYQELSTHLDLSMHSIKNSIQPSINDGTLNRLVIDGCIHVEVANG